jgi:hypothetical protein
VWGCRLVQKFCNFMKELENKHNQEIIKLEKSFKMQCNSSFTQPISRSHAHRHLRVCYKTEIDQLPLYTLLYKMKLSAE